MTRRLFLAGMLVIELATATPLAQTRPDTPAPAAPVPARDSLGRSTPRGTVMGFLTAARKGDLEVARHYLQTSAGDADAEELAHELFIVLDTRLPARLTQVSDGAEGSRANPLALDEERVGTIDTPSGAFDVVVARVKQPKAEPIWLVSRATLERIPAAYGDIAVRSPILPRFLYDRRIGGVRLAEWLAVLIGLPAFYVLTVLLNRVLTPIVALVGRRLFRQADGQPRNALPMPARLLLLSLATRWLLSTLPLSLLVRQSLSNLAAVVAIGAIVWLVILLNAEAERSLVGRIPRANYSAAVALVRVGRRLVDVLILLAGLFSTLRHFGVDATPLLAGLGVGGIAVALAAQKTLENVIAGASLIFDQAVRVGDYLKVDLIEGTVEHIGLRSTRIRTPGRSLVSVPNSQIANMALETLSVRDKFWFHPVVGLRYETTTDQMRVVLDGIRQLLVRQPHVDGSSVRVRFTKLGAFSLDVEVFAYVFARDWPHFLELQEELLLQVSEIVDAAGTGIAFPSQTMYVEQPGTVAATAALAPASSRSSRPGPDGR